MQKTNNEDWMLIIAVLAEGMDIATPGSQAVVLVHVESHQWKCYSYIAAEVQKKFISNLHQDKRLNYIVNSIYLGLGPP